METLPLSSPGPEQNVEYVIERPVSSTSQTSSPAPGCVVTVLVERIIESCSQTFSFIFGGNQVLPWVNEMVDGLSVNQTSLLFQIQEAGEKVEVAKLTLESMGDVDSNFVNYKRNDGKIEASKALKHEANELFKNAKDFKDFLKVLIAYNKSLYSEDDQKARQVLRCNLSLLSLKMREYPNAIIHADAALAKLDSSNISLRSKALLRRSLAFSELGITGNLKSLSDISRCHDLQQHDPIVKREKLRIQKLVTESLEKRKLEFAEVYSVMLQSPLFKNPI